MFRNYKYLILVSILVLFINIITGCSKTDIIGNQNYDVSGKVVTENGEELSYFTVSFNNNYESVLTDEDGNWYKENLSGIVKTTPLEGLYSDHWIFEPSYRIVNGPTHDITFIAKTNPEGDWREPEVTQEGYYSYFNSMFEDKMLSSSINVDGTEVEIFYGNQIYYLKTDDNYVTPYDLSNQRDIYIHHQNILHNNYIEVSGQTYNITFKINNPPDKTVATISNKGVLAFLEPGEVEVIVEIGTFSTTFDITVKKFPENIKEGITKEGLIEKVGFPDKKTSKILPWYDPKGFLDGIYYNYGDYTEDDITIRHYHYDNYPNLVFRIQSFLGTLEAEPIYTKGWDCGYNEQY